MPRCPQWSGPGAQTQPLAAQRHWQGTGELAFYAIAARGLALGSLCRDPSLSSRHRREEHRTEGVEHQDGRASNPACPTGRFHGKLDEGEDGVVVKLLEHVSSVGSDGKVVDVPCSSGPCEQIKIHHASSGVRGEGCCG
eukprot:1293923-Amphidinium_carterae.2